jgi:hypothetical protein
VRNEEAKKRSINEYKLQKMGREDEASCKKDSMMIIYQLCGTTSLNTVIFIVTTITTFNLRHT